jgi:hypothetical protein
LKLVRTTLTFVSLASLAACTLTGPGGIPLHVDERFVHAGQAYSDKEDALAAVKASQDALVAQTRPASDRVGGTLHVHIPDKKSILQRGFKTAKPPSNNVKDFLSEAALLQFKGRHEALVRRGSFDRVVLHSSSGEHIEPGPGEPVVYLHLSGPSQGGWYFSSDKVRRAPLRVDAESWLERLEALAKQAR